MPTIPHSLAIQQVDASPRDVDAYQVPLITMVSARVNTPYSLINVSTHELGDLSDLRAHRIAERWQISNIDSVARMATFRPETPRLSMQQFQFLAGIETHQPRFRIGRALRLEKFDMSISPPPDIGSITLSSFASRASFNGAALGALLMEKLPLSRFEEILRQLDLWLDARYHRAVSGHAETRGR